MKRRKEFVEMENEMREIDKRQDDSRAAERKFERRNNEIKLQRRREREKGASAFVSLDLFPVYSFIWSTPLSPFLFFFSVHYLSVLSDFSPVSLHG